MTSGRWRQIERVFQAALEAGASERETIIEKECAGDAELATSVRRLLQQATGAAERLQSIVQRGAAMLTGAGDGPPRVDVYRIVEPIGAGGMGSVFRGVRDDGLYEQQVAIKLLKAPLLLDDLFLRRFSDERRILARMDHPNVARLLGGGVTPEGLPYLVMEYVDGKPVDQFCRSHSFGVNDRLKLFLAVCDAVQYAHQNLIVHRDLKPDNILVTSGGVPKLLDFGIAKLIEEDPDATRTGVAMMTLDYASPEQVCGEAITTASDVYALGLLLYELLTDSRAQSLSDRSAAEIVRVICEQLPVRPSVAAARRELAGDLDNIVLKAIQKEPARRYASVERMADDIRRYLAGRPVSARPSTVAYRMGKFLRRNLPAVIAAAAGFVVLVAGVYATLRQAAIAERRFGQVRSLASYVVFEFDPALANLPGATPARKLLMQRATAYLDNLSREAKGAPALEMELASAYEKVAAILGSPASPNLGDAAGAIATYRKAIALREQLPARRSRDAENRAVLIADYGDLGTLLMETGDGAGAMASYRKAVSQGEDLVATSPEAAKKVAGVYLGYADLIASRGTLTDALDQYRRGVRTLNEATRRFPQADLRRELGLAYSKTARALQNSGDVKLALEYGQQAFEIREALSRSAPANLEFRRDLWMAHLTLADVLGNPQQFNLDRTGDSLAHYRSALAVAEENAASDPKSYRAQRDLMINLNRLGDVLHKMDQKQEALATFRRANGIVTKLEAADHRPALQRDLAISFDRVGQEMVALGDRNGGVEQIRLGLAIREKLASDPKNTGAQRDLMLSRTTLAEILSDLGKHDEAIEQARRGLLTASALAAADPADAMSHREVAVTCDKLARAYSMRAESRHSSADWTEAADYYRKAIAALDQASSHGAALPSDVAGRAGLQDSLNKCQAALDKFIARR